MGSFHEYRKKADASLNKYQDSLDEADLLGDAIVEYSKAKEQLMLLRQADLDWGKVRGVEIGLQRAYDIVSELTEEAHEAVTQLETVPNKTVADYAWLIEFKQSIGTFNYILRELYKELHDGDITLFDRNI